MNDNYIAAQAAYDRQEPDEQDGRDQWEEDQVTDMLDFCEKLAPYDFITLLRGMCYENIYRAQLEEMFRSAANEEQRSRILK